jgi:hypothetical protein
MNANVDIDAWRQLWQASADGPGAADLRDRVARETRRQKIAMIGPVLVTIVIGGWTLLRGYASPGFDNVLLAVETWLFIAVAWLGGLWIDRGTWRPLSDSTSAFIDISIRRCEAALRGLKFLAVMYVVQLAFVLFWKLQFSSIGFAELMTSWPVIVLGWIAGPALFGFVVWYDRAKRAELSYLLDLRRSSQP